MTGRLGALTLLLLATTALAGCAESSSEEPTTTPAGPDVPGGASAPAPSNDTMGVSAPTNTTEDLVLWSFTECKQLHGIFPYPLPFDWGLPDGWAPDASNSAGVGSAVFVYPTKCAEGDLWMVLLGVEPPEEHQDPAIDLEYWSLTNIVSNMSLASAWEAAGFHVQVGPTTLTQQSGGDVWQAEGSVSTHAISALYGGPNPDGFGTFTQRIWTLDANDAPFAYRMISHNATDFGTGTSVFSAEGDDGAPPASAGLSHRVGAFKLEFLTDRTTLEN